MYPWPVQACEIYRPPGLVQQGHQEVSASWDGRKFRPGPIKRRRPISDPECYGRCCAVPIPDPACEKCATLYGVAHSGPIKFEPIPALPIIKPPAGSGGKFYSFFDISAEVERKDDDKKTKYVYSFEISLSPSQTDPNPKNDRAEFAASNIGRGK